MSGLDMIEDGFPHGTLEGYERGCRHGACPAAANDSGADSCRQAHIRYQGDWEYRKAVDAGLPVPPPVREGKRVKMDPAGRVKTEATITVADTLTPTGRRRAGRPRQPASHPSYSMFQRGCKKDETCPSFIAGGRSCHHAALEWKREWARQKRANLRDAS